MVKGRFTLTRYNLRERDPALHATDAAIVAGLRDLYATLRKGSVGAPGDAPQRPAGRRPGRDPAGRRRLTRPRTCRGGARFDSVARGLVR